MKTRNRFLSLLLVFCMVLGMLPGTVLAADDSLPFSDVQASDWFYDAVAYVYDSGLISGTSATTFSPNVTTSRGMLVTILHRLEGTPDADTAAFADVSADAYYADAVAWANANKLVTGYNAETFGPNDPLTREQTAVILNRYANYKEYDVTADGDLSAFADAEKVSPYASDAMAWAISAGVISGTTGNRLAPQGSATRAQIATILMRFINNNDGIHTVTFDYNYDNKGTYQSVTVEDGKKVSLPTAPSRDGYNFSGWFTDAACANKFDNKTEITSDITLYASWTVKSSGGGGGGGGGGSTGPAVDDSIKHNVTFFLNDGSEGAYRMDSIAQNARVSKPADPSRDFYEFTGWYSDADLTQEYDFSTPVTQELFLYAGWAAPGGSDSLYSASSGGGTTYSITGIEMLESSVSVTVNVNSSAALLVEFLDEETESVLFSVSAQTPDYCELTPITIPVTETLPEHYLIRATLLDEYEAELCTPFVCILYSSSYEAFEAQTVNDFSGENVINFDDSETENFGVLNDEVITISEESGATLFSVDSPVLMADGETEAQSHYIFENPSEQVQNLQVGDSIIAKDANGVDQLFKIGEIQVLDDGSILLIPETDVALSDFYEVLNVDLTLDVADGALDASQNTPELMSIEDVHVDGAWNTSIGSSIDWNISEHLSLSGSLKGTGSVEVKIIYDIKLFKEDYFYCSTTSTIDVTLDAELNLSIDNSESVKKELELARIHIPTPVPGLTIDLEPSIPTEWEISGGGKFKLNAEMKTGFIYDTYSGAQRIDEKTRSLELMLQGKAEIKFGPKFAIGVAFCDEILEASLAVQAGIEASAETEIGGNWTDGESKHACALCLKGECKWFAELSFDVSYCVIPNVLEGKAIDWDLLRFEGWINFSERYPGKFYLSLLNNQDSCFKGHIHFGGGSCPNTAWRTEIITTDESGNELTGISLNVSRTNSSSTWNGSSTYTEYLYDGIYTVTATINGNAASKTFIVNGTAQAVALSSTSADATLRGTICDSESHAPIADATIIIYQGDMVLQRIVSDASGNYSLSLPEGTYLIEITKGNYIPFSKYQHVENGRETFLETAMMVSGSRQYMGGFAGQILDATTGAPVNNVALKLRKGWDNSSEGEIIETLYTDVNGYFRYATTEIFGVVFGLQSGNYTLTTSKSGYTSKSFNIVVRPGVVTENQNTSISPSMTDGEYRIVLTWGEYPFDLDSHFNAKNESGFRTHVYYSQMSADGVALDVDDTSSYGPETITVSSFDAYPNGFTYSIHDFSNGGEYDSHALSNSGATVALYNGSTLLRTYYVPTGRTGTVWHVFSIDADGNITDLNLFETDHGSSSVGAQYGSDDSQLFEVIENPEKETKN